MKLLKNVRLSKNFVNILFDEKIRDISCSPFSERDISSVIDVKEKLVLPGCIDPHVHFNDPGFLKNEDFLTGTKSAAAGGVTTIIDMPCTSIPPVTSTQSLKIKLKAIEPKAFVDFALWGGIRGNSFSKGEIIELWKAGVVGFKMYAISGMETFKALNYQKIESILKDFSGSDLLFAFHAEDKQIIENATKKIGQKDLKNWKYYIKSRPCEAEIEAVSQILKRMSNNRIHFVHISTKGASKKILEAKKSGKDVTFETCPQYLQFTEQDFSYLLGKLKTAPGVKHQPDKEFLRKCLENSLVDFVATDHAGCDYEKGKNLADFSKIYCGIPGIETLVIYIVDEFFLKGKISYQNLTNILSANQAKRYGLFPQKGVIKIGSDADFTIIDINKPAIFNEQKLSCKGKYSPFHNRKFNCSINNTIVRGKSVYSKEFGFTGKQGYGRLIKQNR